MCEALFRAALRKVGNWQRPKVRLHIGWGHCWEKEELCVCVSCLSMRSLYESRHCFPKALLAAVLLSKMVLLQHVCNLSACASAILYSTVRKVGNWQQPKWRRTAEDGVKWPPETEVFFVFVCKCRTAVHVLLPFFLKWGCCSMCETFRIWKVRVYCMEQHFSTNLLPHDAFHIHSRLYMCVVYSQWCFLWPPHS